jgi:predicted XRE-type DNA-binding protein
MKGKKENLQILSKLVHRLWSWQKQNNFVQALGSGGPKQTPIQYCGM